MNLKNWILENLFCKNITISSRMSLRWFTVNSKLFEYNEIIAATSFLPDDITIGQRVWHILNNKLEPIKCSNINCNNLVKFHSYGLGYSKNCSYKCAQTNQSTKNNIKYSNIKKYGTEYGFQNPTVKEKCKATIMEKYGVDNVSKSLEISNKKKETCLKNYGVEWILSDKSKIENAVFKKYGVKNIQQVKSVANKRINTRRGIFYDSLFTSNRLQSLAEPLFSRDEYLSGGLFKKYKFKCNICKVVFDDCLEDGDLPRCTTCNSGISTFEKEVTDFIRSILPSTISVEENKRILLNNRELDIYIPILKIAIECDGLYWHSEIGGCKNKTYHVSKTEECEKIGIRLIHLFEDEWINKKELIKSKLKHILKRNASIKINARKCIIKEITDNSYIDFLNNNHIQGKEKTSSIRLGAYHNNELVAVATFGQLRKCLGQVKKDGTYELYRLCVKTSYIITGICDKLLKHFITNYKPIKIISYADRRWSFSNSNVYEKLNLKLTGKTAPSYWYFGNHRKNYKRYHRFNFRKDQLSKILKSFNPSLSEWENMKNNGWDRIWDCGNFKYEWNI